MRNTPKGVLPQVLKRIEDGRIKYEDIQYKDRLTPDQIASIEPELVFQYIQCNKWKFKDFKRWLDSFSEEE